MDDNPLSDFNEGNTDHLTGEESSMPGDVNFSAIEQRQRFLGGLGSEKIGDPDKSGVEKKSGTDIREYFRATFFQKKAEEIDSNSSHPWNSTVDGGFLAQNDSGVVLAGETYDDKEPQGSKAGILILGKTADGQISSLFTKNLTKEQRLAVLDEIHTVTPCLPDSLRYLYIQKLIQEIPNISDKTIIQERLATLALDLLPDLPNNSLPFESLDWDKLSTKPSADQQEQLTTFLSIVGRKMPADKYRERIQRFQDDLRFIDDPFGRNYGDIFTQARQWVLQDRDDTPRNYDLLKRTDPQEYSIKDKITRKIESQDDLENFLETIPIEEMPDVSSKARGAEIAEMVSIDQIVGGANMKKWSISTSEGRGLPRIYQLAKHYSEGSENIAGKNDPIRVIKVNGKFFVETDGRHRTAALKALGVKEVPMLVAHISSK